MDVPIKELGPGWQKAFWVVLGFLFVIHTSLGSWAIWESYQLNIRVTSIEANRFTSLQGNELLKLINEKANKTEVPPQWFREEVLTMKNDLRRIEERLRVIEIRLGGTGR